MRAHCRNGVNKRSAVLNLHSVIGVGVVAAPDLRRVVEHTCVKTSATAAAVFNKNVGEVCVYAVHNLVNAEHIAVVELALSVLGERTGISVGNVSVHIPLNVGNGALG